MDINTKFNLIVDGLQEVIGEKELIHILKDRNLNLKVVFSLKLKT